MTSLKDEADGYAWFLTGTNLKGVSLNAGGANTSRNINWSGGSIPWKYNSTRSYAVAVVSDLLFVRVYSYDFGGTSAYQNDLYVLKPVINCGA